MDEIDVITDEIRKLFAGDSSGHDVWHSLRVHKTAMKIAQTETCDARIVSIASLLHDVDDVKLFNSKNYENAKRIMDIADIEPDVAAKVIKIIGQVSFKGTDSEIPDMIEGKIVQDADRIDALGAIGIARAFAFGGAKGRCMYDPNVAPVLNANKDTYRENIGTTVNHFYEKLFLLKDMMNTEYAKKIAIERDLYLHKYLDEFLDEMEGL